MEQISIVGTTGSGKTTLARQVAQRGLVPQVELDALQWEPNLSLGDWSDRINHPG